MALSVCSGDICNPECVLPFQQVRPQDEPDENIVVRDVPKELVEQLESAP